MTPEMWLDLEPIPHRASCIFCRRSPESLGVQHGVALQLAWPTSHVLPEMCATYLSVVLCCAWVGWGTNFLHAVVQACPMEQRSGRPGPDESDLLHVVTKRLGAALDIVLVRALLSFIGHTTDC